MRMISTNLARQFVASAALVVLIPTTAIGQASPWPVDTDGDGYPDVTDNCPTLANSQQCDTDGDGLGNQCDGDFDGSGFSVSGADLIIYIDDFYNNGQMDSGGGTDMNCNGVVDTADYSPFVIDQVNRSIAGPGSLFCATGSGCPDTDQDGIPDDRDNCADHKNFLQCDDDLDGFGNACDGDYNNNGAVELLNDWTIMWADWNSGVPTPGAGTDGDCNGAITTVDWDFFVQQLAAQVPTGSSLSCAGTAPCADSDRDGIIDSTDNCPSVPNVGQRDFDSDGMGDACESTTVLSTVASLSSTPTAPAKFRPQFIRDSAGAKHIFFAEYSSSPLPELSIEHIFESTPGGSYIQQTVGTFPGSASSALGGITLRAAIDQVGSVCIPYQPAGQNIRITCWNGSAYSTEIVSTLIQGGLSRLKLAYDSNNDPHIIVYQHGAIDDATNTPGTGTNHSVRHFWRNSGQWMRELVPIPAPPLAMSDPATKGSCVYIDSADTMHVAMSAFEDTIISGLPKDASLVYSAKSSAGTWSTEVVLQDLDDGTPSTHTDGKQCDFVTDSNGDLNVVYRTVEGRRYFVTQSTGGWTSIDLPPLEHINSGYSMTPVFVDSSLLWVADDVEPKITRIDTSTSPPTAIEIATDVPDLPVDPLTAAGAGVFAGPSTSGVGSDCELLTLLAATPAVLGDYASDELARTSIERCDHEFAVVPRPDFDLPLQ